MVDAETWIMMLQGFGSFGVLLYIATKAAIINSHSGLMLEALGRLERKEVCKCKKTDK